MFYMRKHKSGHFVEANIFADSERGRQVSLVRGPQNGRHQPAK